MLIFQQSNDECGLYGFSAGIVGTLMGPARCLAHGCGFVADRCPGGTLGFRVKDRTSLVPPLSLCFLCDKPLHVPGGLRLPATLKKYVSTEHPPPPDTFKTSAPA